VILAIALFVFLYATSEWLVEFQHPALSPQHRRFLTRVYKLTVIVLASAFFACRLWPDYASWFWYGTVALGAVVNTVALRRIAWL
jgi:hypothetical protein